MATSELAFTYKGTDRRGQKVAGEVFAPTVNLAKAQLRRQGVVAKSVKRKAKPLFGRSGKPVKPGDIAIFTRQLATMMKAGVPLVQSFEIVAEGADNPKLRELINQIRLEVASGTSLARSLGKHPDHFDDLFCSLVGSGEESGTLEVMLDRVATYKEKTEALKAKIKKALTYPIATIVVAVVVTAILLIKVVPTFAETFQSFGSDLPSFTLFVLGISEWVQAWWFVILIGMSVGAWSFTRARKRSRSFNDWVDGQMLKLPIIGNILKDAVVARFSRTLSTTFAAGVPLVEALNSTAGAAGNAVFARAIRRVRDEVTAGTSLYQAIRGTGLFPTMLLQMTSIGEESGALDDMLGKVADHYEAAVDNAVDNISSLIEPMIMSVLGVVIGGLMIAMYLPIFMLGSVI
jgi:type IV pilus assembly protein PilC